MLLGPKRDVWTALLAQEETKMARRADTVSNVVDAGDEVSLNTLPEA